MRKEVQLLIARQFWASTFKSKAIFFLMGIMVVLLIYAVYSGIEYHDQNHFRADHQEKARESWEGNPDKHPHRMAHFGTFAFRVKHPLSVFDFGIESYTGNVVFLEAHRQNMVNFSEAGFSTGLLRFGELSMGMILQVILPLMIFFIGYASVASDRENGTLKVLLTQGASWKEILFGRSIGLFSIALLFILPFMVMTAVLLLVENHATGDQWLRLGMLTGTYLLFAAVLSLITIVISAKSQSSKGALVKLLGLWLVMTVLLPRTAQSLGAYFYPAPNKLEFKGAIEQEVIEYGDSHDPDDPHFAALKDSILKANNVASVDQLSFNYGGLVMSEGEKISTRIYNKHHHKLLDTYRNQNQWSRWMALVNPYLAVKNLSMALCGTDFESYVSFQMQAEDYRYHLAQKMNELQIKYISPNRVSGSEGKVDVVKQSEWKAFPDFEYQFLSFGSTLRNEGIALVSLLIWSLFSVWLAIYLSQKINHRLAMYQFMITQFLRTRTCQLGLILILALGLISIVTGKQFLDDQAEMVAQAVESQEEHISRNLEFHGDDFGLLLYYLKFSLIKTQNPLAALSIGQNDLNPSIQNVKILTLEGQKYDTDLVNPIKLLYGNLDLSFILVYIFPLLIIAFTYNLISEEEESGTWKMVTVTVKSKMNFILSKLLVRLGAILMVMSLLYIVASWVLDIPWDKVFLVFFLMGVFYQLFWFALSFWVISFKNHSNFNALVLLSSWLLLVVLLPATINNAVTSSYPVPEALSTMIKQRDGYHQKWDTNKKETMESFYKDYPQFAKYGFPPEEGFSWLWYYAMQHLGDAESREDSEAMQHKITQRQKMSKQVAQFLPSMHTLLTFNELAETSLSHHMNFLQATNDFHENTRLYFYPRIFSESSSEEVDWAQFKPEFYEPEDSPISLFKSIGPLCLGMLIFLGLAGLGYQRNFRS